MHHYTKSSNVHPVDPPQSCAVLVHSNLHTQFHCCIHFAFCFPEVVSRNSITRSDQYLVKLVVVKVGFVSRFFDTWKDFVNRWRSNISVLLDRQVLVRVSRLVEWVRLGFATRRIRLVKRVSVQVTWCGRNVRNVDVNFERTVGTL